MGQLAKVEVLPPQDFDAIEIGQLYRKGKTSMVDSVRYLIEAGQRLVAKKRNLGHGNWLPWLEQNKDELGFGELTAQRLIKAADRAKSIVDDGFDEAEATKLNREIWGNSNGGPRTLGTGEDERYTPEQHIELARAVLGKIDLDPASSAEAQKTVKAGKFFTKEKDGLQREWHGRVWLNPPYSTPLLGQFVDKLLVELAADRTTAAILLTHNCTDTSWFHKAAELMTAACFTRGRINFTGQSPPCGQTFFYFGEDIEAFAREFSSVGLILVPHDHS